MAHMQKLKRPAVGGMMHHYRRDRQATLDRPNIDASRTPLNYTVGTGDPVQMMRAAIESHDAHGRALRSDAVVMADWVVTAPRDLRAGDERRFFSAVHDWMVERYGARAVPCGYVHMDEATPHMHQPVVPLCEDGRLRASQMLGRSDLRTWHQELQEHVDGALGYHVGVLLDEGERGRRQLSALSQTEYRAARDELTRAQSDAAAARAEADAAQAREATMRASEERQAERLSEVWQQRADMETERDAARRDRDAAQAEAAQARADAEHSAAWRDTMAASEERQAARLSEVWQQREDAERRRDEAQARADAAESDAEAAVRDAVAAADREREQAESAAQAARASLSQVRGEVAAAEAERDAARGDRDAAQAELARAQTERDEARRDRDAAHGWLSNLTEALEYADSATPDTYMKAIAQLNAVRHNPIVDEVASAPEVSERLDAGDRDVFDQLKDAIMSAVRAAVAAMRDVLAGAGYVTPKQQSQQQAQGYQSVIGGKLSHARASAGARRPGGAGHGGRGHGGR